MNGLTEEDMRLHVHILDPLEAIPAVIIVPPATAARKCKVEEALTPRLKAALLAGNVFEGKTQELVH